MRKLTIIAFLAASLNAFAGITSSNLLSYQAITGNPTTNNGVAVLVGTAYISAPPSFIVQNGGLVAGTLGGTNALTARIQFGLDTNTFSTVTTYNPAITNAQDEVISPASFSVNIYARVQIVTTTNVSVGTKAVFISQ